jgi:glycosyltransferase involved in cell wall biosynthesis
MSPLRISVITVCFNAAGTIERTILSVSKQTHPAIEYIIVDGQSTDGTLDIVRRHSGAIARVISEKDHGIFDAMNKGVALSTGEVIYFLNADDYFVDDRVLNDVASTFQEDPRRAFVYGNVVLQDEPNGVLCYPATPLRNGSISGFLHNSFCHQAVFARKSLFDELGRFDERYKYSADYEWIIRAFKRKRGRDFFFLDRSIAYYSCLGRSNRVAAVTRKEVNRIQLRHFRSTEYFWYFLRYVFLRRIKKRLLNQTY